LEVTFNREVQEPDITQRKRAPLYWVAVAFVIAGKRHHNGNPVHTKIFHGLSTNTTFAVGMLFPADLAVMVCSLNLTQVSYLFQVPTD
jgi:hypothetical protein